MTDGRAILYIDDDQANRLLIERLFARKRADDRVIVAETGSRGLREADSTKVDLVLLDLTLPDLSGEEVLRRLKADHDMPVVILTGHADDETRQRLMDAGATHFLPKPFDALELLGLIDRLLS